MKKTLSKIFSPLLKWKYRHKEKARFKEQIAKNTGLLKVVVGSGYTFPEGWILSDMHFLNLLKPSEWEEFFTDNAIDYLLAEHVWEHLTPEQAQIASNTCYRFLKKGGKLRVAVPDGFHKDNSYIEVVKPNGTGGGSDDHKVLYNYKTFSKVFENSGFEIQLLEYFDENKEFNAIEWNEEEGFISRSFKNDWRNKDGNPNYTSLLLDAIKK